MKPGLLAALLRDTGTIADRAIRLKELLPRTNVSIMASKLPEILLQVISSTNTRSGPSYFYSVHVTTPCLQLFMLQ